MTVPLSDLKSSSSLIVFLDVPLIASVIAKHAWYWRLSGFWQNDSLQGLSYKIPPQLRCCLTNDLYIVNRLRLGRIECSFLVMRTSFIYFFSYSLTSCVKSSFVSRYTSWCFWKLDLTTGELLKTILRVYFFFLFSRKYYPWGCLFISRLNCIFNI